MTEHTYSLSFSTVGAVTKIIEHASRKHIVDCIVDNIKHLPKTTENYPYFLIIDEETRDIAVKVPAHLASSLNSITLRFRILGALSKYNANLDDDVFNPTIEVA